MSSVSASTYVGRHRLLAPTPDAGRHRVDPTFTTARILFLILIGPLVFLAVALLINFGDQSWILHVAWLGTDTTGAPIVGVGR